MNSQKCWIMFPWNWGNRRSNSGYPLKAKWTILWPPLRASIGSPRLGRVFCECMIDLPLFVREKGGKSLLGFSQLKKMSLSNFSLRFRFSIILSLRRLKIDNLDQHPPRPINNKALQRCFQRMGRYCLDNPRPRPTVR